MDVESFQGPPTTLLAGAGQRLEELKRLRRGRALIGEAPKGASLADLARQHLILKKESAKQTDRWIASAQVHLERACEFFGASRPLMAIAVEDVQRWIAHLERLKSGRGGTLSAGTVRHHLKARGGPLAGDRGGVLAPSTWRAGRSHGARSSPVPSSIRSSRRSC